MTGFKHTTNQYHSTTRWNTSALKKQPSDLNSFQAHLSSFEPYFYFI